MQLSKNTFHCITVDSGIEKNNRRGKVTNNEKPPFFRDERDNRERNKRSVAQKENTVDMKRIPNRLFQP